MIKLSAKTLPQLKDRAQVPQYDRTKYKSGIVHMSVGGFHRSHQALYIDELMSKEPGDWLITGVGLLDSDKEPLAALAAQDHYYTVVERTATEDTIKIVGAIHETLHAPSNPAAVLKRLQDPAIKILSLTITEKGYCYDSKGDLDPNNPGIQHDLKNLNAPKTGIGYVVAALRDRMNAGAQPFTVMSCDNLPGNGHRTKHIVTQFAKLVDAKLAAWIEQNVHFPNAMVDRITPATTDKVVAFVREKCGIDDAWPVVCEDFRQWVLEDDFGQGRPALEKAGVQMVGDVEPYELMKVRLLNGSHSALSYLSYLMGYREVDVAMADPLMSGFVRAYMDNDVTPSVPSVPGIDLNNYKDTLIRRFSNPAISDKIQRLAEDGSQKIPNAILPCIRHALKNNGSIAFACLALAGWFRYMTGTDEQGAAIEIKDPRRDEMTKRINASPENPAGVLGITEIFGTDLMNNDRFVKTLTQTMADLRTLGARGILETSRAKKAA